MSCIEPTGISLVLIVVMSVCGLVIFLLVFVFISCACSRRDPGDGKGKYTATTHLRRWGTVVRTHTPNIHHPANREANNGHITDRYMDAEM